MAPVHKYAIAAAVGVSAGIPVLIFVGYIWLLFFSDSPVTPPLPTILQGIHAGGELGCPDGFGNPKQVGKQTELDQRLSGQFPTGSDPAVVHRFLIEQGFVEQAGCQSDPSIRIAAFRQTGGGMRSFPMTALVAWKTDPQGTLAWVRSSVGFTGP